MLEDIIRSTTPLPASVPFITLTYAQSLDGSIARAKGIPTAISGNLSLKMTHRLRELHRGILVGVDTLISDNPSLTVRYREEDAVHPDVIIVDSNLRIPLGSKVVENIEKDRRRVLVAYANENVSGKRMEEIQRKGVELVLCKSDDCGRVDLEDMFWKLHEKRIPSIMIEGGASIIHSLLTNQKYAKHLNQIVITISPQFIPSGLNPLHCGLNDNDQAIKLKNISSFQLENDVILVANFQN